MVEVPSLSDEMLAQLDQNATLEGGGEGCEEGREGGTEGARTTDAEENTRKLRRPDCLQHQHTTWKLQKCSCGSRVPRRWLRLDPQACWSLKGQTFLKLLSNHGPRARISYSLSVGVPERSAETTFRLDSFLLC